MSGIIFGCGEMLQEIEHMKALSKPFISVESHSFVLHEWKEQLNRFQRRPYPNFSWQIPVEKPIKTNLSCGAYQPNGAGGRRLYGTVSAIWEISSDNPANQRQKCNRFLISGNGSTVVKVFEHQDDVQDHLVAEWRFDIGAEDSPGCYLHNQINWAFAGNDENGTELDIPRLPTILITPMDALEFVIGELFQDEWPKHTVAATSPVARWRSIQKNRLLHLLAWNYNAVHNSRGSPWTSLKNDRPTKLDLARVPPRLVGYVNG